MRGLEILKQLDRRNLSVLHRSVSAHTANCYCTRHDDDEEGKAEEGGFDSVWARLRRPGGGDGPCSAGVAHFLNPRAH